MAKINKKVNIFLLVVVLLASFLRLYKLDSVPASLYIDELDLGYQAYSILHTGRDYFGNFLPLHPHSIAEYRTPFNIYTLIPTIAIFGINAWGVRLPSALFGILTVWAMYFVVYEMLSYTPLSGKLGIAAKNLQSRNDHIAAIAALVLAVSPWHIQLSRVNLEASPLLFFLFVGTYFFLKSFSKPKLLLLAFFAYGITPWIYSTAKMFTPLLIVFLGLTFFQDLIKIQRKYLIISIAILAIFALPLMYLTVNGKAGSRFNYISVFSDPTTSTEVNYVREFDATVRGENQIGAIPTTWDRLFHNKLTFWGEKIIGNYLNAFSTDFLFVRGDLNLRHSPKGVGQLYTVEAISLITGVIFVFTKFQNSKIKALILFWLLAGVLPSSLTRDGGGHAIRLILILFPLVFLISNSIGWMFDMIVAFKIKGRTYNFGKLVLLGYFIAWFVGFLFYQHNYWVHYKWDSERWWSFGYDQVVAKTANYDSTKTKIIISDADGNPSLYLAGYSRMDPQLFWAGRTTDTLVGVGAVEKLANFYIGHFNLYQYAKAKDTKLAKNAVYVAQATEWDKNLIREPNMAPDGLKLVDWVAYPSGEPAFYFLQPVIN